MRRNEFLLELDNELEGLPNQVRSEILRDYDDHFASGLEEGRTEEEIAESLGDPHVLGRELSNQYGGSNFTPPPPPPPPMPPRNRRYGRSHRGWWILILILVFGGSGFWGRWGNLFGIGKLYDINDIKETNLSSVRRIEISVSSADTTILSSDTQKVQASLTGSVRTTNPKSIPYLEMTVSGDTLRITEVKPVQFSFGFHLENVKLNLSIPSQFSGDVSFASSSGDFKDTTANLSSLKIQTSSGDVTLGNLTLTNEFRFDTSSGELSLDGLKAGSAEFSSSSGDRKINTIEVSGDVVLSTSSGDTTINGLSAGNASFGSSSGNFNMDRAAASRVTVKTSSGEINIGSLEGSADISSSSGDAKLSFQRLGSGISVSTSSGRIEIGLPSDAQFTLNASTGSGDIKSGFELDNVKADKRSLRGSIGSGETKIDLSTSSGNINVNKN